MIALVNGKVMTMEGTVYEKGTVLIAGSKIVAVGENLDLPTDIEVIDVQGKYITPGIIDAHTHMGIEEEIHPAGEDTNEMTDPLTPHLRALDAINPRDIAYQDARNAGITTVMVTPGSANPIGGVIAVMKTAGKNLKDMVMIPEAGIKIAFGENPKRVYGSQKKTPQTRMATMALMRQAFYAAKDYGKKEDREFDLGKEHLLMALEGKITVRAHAHRADDIMTAIRLRDEFGLDLVIEHCTEGHLIVDDLLEAGVSVVVGPSLSSRAKVEMEHVTFKTPGILASAGINVALMTDHPCTPIHYLPMCAGLAVGEGMTEEDALKALTINPAKILKIEDRVGSLKEGKDADIVVWDNHPLQLNSKPGLVFINGKVVNN